jgi:hypothetical protein
MEHVVFYPGPDGAPSFRRFASLEEAVGFVEHLRNAEDVAEASVHALIPVPLAFRAYYKVEVPAAESELPPVAAEVPVQAVEPIAEVVPLLEESMHDDPMPDGSDDVAAPVEEFEPTLVPVPDVDGEPVSNGKRSLGFFAH